MKILKINADMGEGMPLEAELMSYVDSCSVACGGHAGDAGSIADTLKLARKYKVAAGAHPSYPDKENFGRKTVVMDSEELYQELLQQVQLFSDISHQHDIEVDHIKPHGALYNDAAHDEKIAEVLIRLTKQFRGAKLYVPPGSKMDDLARVTNLPVVTEAFADRRYDRNARLLPRDHTESLITNPEEAVSQVREIYQFQRLTTIENLSIRMTAETFCVHSDNPAALDIVKAIRKAFH